MEFPQPAEQKLADSPPFREEGKPCSSNLWLRCFFDYQFVTHAQHSRNVACGRVGELPGKLLARRCVLRDRFLFLCGSGGLGIAERLTEEDAENALTHFTQMKMLSFPIF